MQNCDHHEKDEEWMNGWQSFVVVRNSFETHTIKNFHTDSGTIRLFKSYIICIYNYIYCLFNQYIQPFHSICSTISLNIFNHFNMVKLS